MKQNISISLLKISYKFPQKIEKSKKKINYTKNKLKLHFLITKKNEYLEEKTNKLFRCKYV